MCVIFCYPLSVDGLLACISWTFVNNATMNISVKNITVWESKFKSSVEDGHFALLWHWEFQASLCVGTFWFPLLLQSLPYWGGASVNWLPCHPQNWSWPYACLLWHFTLLPAAVAAPAAPGCFHFTSPFSFSDRNRIPSNYFQSQIEDEDNFNRVNTIRNKRLMFQVSF